VQLKDGGPPTRRFDHHGDMPDRQLSERYCDVASAFPQGHRFPAIAGAHLGRGAKRHATKADGSNVQPGENGKFEAYAVAVL
jgi:hypothetical protein